jgi:hypothetical protein
MDDDVVGLLDRLQGGAWMPWLPAGFPTARRAKTPGGARPSALIRRRGQAAIGTIQVQLIPETLILRFKRSNPVLQLPQHREQVFDDLEGLWQIFDVRYDN